MKWLARLKIENALNPCPTQPTKLLHENQGMGSVGFVGHAPAISQKIVACEAEVKDTRSDTAADTDRYCWPYSYSMNGRETEAFSERLARFTNMGIGLDDAERLADKLVIRDREADDRRLCLECGHLHRVGHWRCGNWKAADVGRDGLAFDLVLTLQRCFGFRSAMDSPQ